MLRVFHIAQAALFALATAIAVGVWQAPLPFPATVQQRIAHELAPDKLAGEPMQLTGALEPNAILKSKVVRLFDDSIHGTESVAPGPDDTSVTLLDRWGNVWIADYDSRAPTYRLRPEPLAYLGPGRPLGYRYDRGGNLVVCDSLKGLIMLEGAAQAAAAQRTRLRAADAAVPPSTSPSGTAAADAERAAAAAAADASGEADGAGEGRMEGLTIDPTVALAGGSGAEAKVLSRPRIVILSNRVSRSSPLEPDTPITYANDLDISPTSGQIFFTDCQNITTALNRYGFYDTFWSWMLGFFSGNPTGRLLRYDPADGTTTVLATDLWYANGVALAADESFVAVAETNVFRVMRYWLKGPKAGTMDVLIEHLPGFPDGISRSEDGNIWVAVLAPRLPITKIIRYPLVRTVGAWLPSWLRPKATPQGLIIKVSPEGQVLASFWDQKGEIIAAISGVEEHNGRVWLGQLSGSGVGYFDL